MTHVVLVKVFNYDVICHVSWRQYISQYIVTCACNSDMQIRRWRRRQSPFKLQAMREEEYWQKVQMTMGQRKHKVWRDEWLPMPESWQLMTNGSTSALRSLQLRIPNSRYNRASWLSWLVYLCKHCQNDSCRS